MKAMVKKRQNEFARGSISIVPAPVPRPLAAVADKPLYQNLGQSTSRLGSSGIVMVAEEAVHEHLCSG